MDFHGLTVLIFIMFNFPIPSTGRYPTASLKDKNGTFWFGCNDGTVFYAEKNNLIPVPLSNSKSISDLLEGPDGLIYVIPQGKAVFRLIQ